MHSKHLRKALLCLCTFEPSSASTKAAFKSKAVRQNVEKTRGDMAWNALPQLCWNAKC